MADFKDIRRDYDNYRTRDKRIAISNPCLDYENNNLVLFHLPAGVYTTNTLVDVVKEDGTTGATIDVVAVPASPKPTFEDIENSDIVLADEVNVNSKGLKQCTTCKPLKFDKEMLICTRDGDVAGSGKGAFSVTVEFIEYNKKVENGLLRIPMRSEEIIDK